MGLFDKEPKFEKFQGIPPNERKRWDKEEVKTLIKMWPNSTVEEICAVLDRPASGVQNIVYSLRKMGLDLPSKRIPVRPKLQETIKAALDELNLPYN